MSSNDYLQYFETIAIHQSSDSFALLNWSEFLDTFALAMDSKLYQINYYSCSANKDYRSHQWVLMSHWAQVDLAGRNAIRSLCQPYFGTENIIRYSLVPDHCNYRNLFLNWIHIDSNYSIGGYFSYLQLYYSILYLGHRLANLTCQDLLLQNPSTCYCLQRSGYACSFDAFRQLHLQTHLNSRYSARLMQWEPHLPGRRSCHPRAGTAHVSGCCLSRPCHHANRF